MRNLHSLEKEQEEEITLIDKMFIYSLQDLLQGLLQDFYRGSQWQKLNSLLAWSHLESDKSKIY